MEQQLLVERKPMAVFTAEQSAEFLSDQAHSHLLAGVALATGRGEVLGLRWKDVDLDRASLRVVESVEPTKAGLRF